MVCLVVYLSLVSMPLDVFVFTASDKFGHALAYAAMMGWFGQLYVTFRRQALLAVGFCALGVVLEFLQGWGGTRMFEAWDMLANVTGVALGWWLTRGWLAGLLVRIERVLIR